MKSGIRRDITFDEDDIKHLIGLYMKKKFPKETIESINLNDDVQVVVVCSRREEEEAEEES